MPESFINKVRRLNAARTPGEWWNESGTIHAHDPHPDAQPGSAVHPAGFTTEPDAEFIALAPTLAEQYEKLWEAVQAGWEPMPLGLSSQEWAARNHAWLERVQSALSYQPEEKE